MWDDDDDSSVDGELLYEYLERVGAKDLTKEEVEVNVDEGLSKMGVDAYHSLSTLQKLNWITWQLLLGRYDTPLRGIKPEPPPQPEESARGPWFMYSDDDESDYEDSGKDESDYEDPGEHESDYEDSVEDD
uniref:uncharacterized protein LOC122600124 n=1 Tax=Erigeron canadensis TaxID=72917 RepID=UPI001CB90325|nr:uncharacterized protein LOC122600124 [Erigeron canadensis]